MLQIVQASAPCAALAAACLRNERFFAHRVNQPVSGQRPLRRKAQLKAALRGIQNVFAHRAVNQLRRRENQCAAAILQASCHADGEAVYRDEAEVLDDLTPREMERMLTLLAEGRQPEQENPAFDSERFEALRGA